VQLNKSYRCTYEIISFAKRIKGAGTIEAVQRHGENPRVILCRDEQNELTAIQNAIGDFRKSAYSSMGIIAKTNEDAKQIYELLSANLDVHLLSPDSTSFAGGVSVTSIPMAKGLEFDEVIITDVDSKRYSTEYDRSLLYIACTRAMHRLTLFHIEECSPLLTDADKSV
jgi:DNA helicase-2/ATP-dependent DNA helicase PcrA